MIDINIADSFNFKDERYLTIDKISYNNQFYLLVCKIENDDVTDEYKVMKFSNSKVSIETNKELLNKLREIFNSNIRDMAEKLKDVIKTEV